jgi:hypothetical protein
MKEITIWYTKPLRLKPRGSPPCLIRFGGIVTKDGQLVEFRDNSYQRLNEELGMKLEDYLELGDSQFLISRLKPKPTIKTSDYIPNVPIPINEFLYHKIELERDLDKTLKNLKIKAEELRFQPHMIGLGQMEYQRKTGDITERLDWHEEKDKILLSYARESPNQKPLYLDDGEFDKNLNPLNPVASQILEKIGYNKKV